MKDNKMKLKTISLVAVMVSMLALSACTHDDASVPDDVRPISKSEKSNILNAETAPDVTTAPTVAPPMGAGLIETAKTVTADPIDKGTRIIVPMLDAVTVEKNEKVQLYAGQLVVGSTMNAVLFYSGNGQNNKEIDLGEVTVDANGEIKKEIIIPANLASGEYVISLNIDDTLFATPIKVV